MNFLVTTTCEAAGLSGSIVSYLYCCVECYKYYKFQFVNLSFSGIYVIKIYTLIGV